MTSPWEDLVTTATLGTDRRPLDVSTWPGPVGDLARTLPGAGPGLLLDAAALAATYRRAGARPAGPAAAPAPEAPEPVRQEVPAAAAARLRDLLTGGPAGLLAQWLGLAAAAGRRVPADTLPVLLDLAVARPDLSGAVGAVLDLPGAWLAGFRPEWTRAVAAAAAGLEGPPQPGWWTHGSTEQRAAWLASARGSDPGAARAALAAGWDRERADERARFLALLAVSLGRDDEPLLERALDDRSTAVRQQAAALLARLPGSAFLGRWRAWLAARARVQRRGVLGPVRLRLDPAAGSDPDPRDLALAPGPGAARGSADAALVRLAAAPAAAWDVVATEPADLVALPVEGVERELVHRAWALAAARDGHAGLARALLDAGRSEPGLLALLPPAERVERVVLLTSRDPGGEAAAARLLAVPGPWPGSLSRAAVGLVVRGSDDVAATGRARGVLGAVGERADAADPAAAGAVRRLADALPATSPLLPAVHAALAMLTVRAQMQAEMHAGTHAGTHAETPDRGER